MSSPPSLLYARAAFTYPYALCNPVSSNETAAGVQLLLLLLLLWLFFWLAFYAITLPNIAQLLRVQPHRACCCFPFLLSISSLVCRVFFLAGWSTGVLVGQERAPV